jgi:hypothetical protein
MKCYGSSPTERPDPTPSRHANQKGVAESLSTTNLSAGHQAPGAGAGVGPTAPRGNGTAPWVHDLLEDGEQVEGAARAAVDARHHQHVAGVELVEDAAQLRPSPCRDKSAACAANGKGAAAHILLTAWPFLEE